MAQWMAIYIDVWEIGQEAAVVYFKKLLWSSTTKIKKQWKISIKIGCVLPWLESNWILFEYKSHAFNFEMTCSVYHME
jgi:hypothetical protein